MRCEKNRTNIKQNKTKLCYVYVQYGMFVEELRGNIDYNCIIFVHMFNKQNKTLFSENWNSYRNAQSVIAITAMTVPIFIQRSIIR